MDKTSWTYSISRALGLCKGKGAHCYLPEMIGALCAGQLLNALTMEELLAARSPQRFHICLITSKISMDAAINCINLNSPLYNLH